MPTPILGIAEVAPTQTDKTTTINDAIVALENATQGQLPISLVGGTVTLTATQFTGAVVFVTSGQTATAVLTVPLSKRLFAVHNTGAYGVTVGGASGTSVTVAAGAGNIIQCDGTNCVLFGTGSPPAATWSGGTVTALGPGLLLSSGTLDIEASARLRTLPFAFVGTLPNAQKYSVCLTQAGTLLANGGTPQAYVPTNPTATEHLTLNTIHAGTITNQGTIAIGTTGTVTWPTFTAVSVAAGDVVQLVNQGTADVTFADACLSLQFAVT